jgi:hypothetical protein
MPFDYAALEAEINSLGEEEVRARYLRDEYISHDIRYRYVQNWLLSKDSARRDAREAETLSIAKEANRIASEARTAAFEQARWAKWAAIIAMVAAIIAVALSK